MEGRYPYLQYDVVSDGTEDSQSANKQGGIPAPGNAGPTGFWVTSMIYRNYQDDSGTWRSFNQKDAGKPFLADMWARKNSDKGAGVYVGQGWWAHQEGYNVAWLDGHVEWYDDPGKEVMKTPVLNAEYAKQEQHWKDYFENN